MSIVKPTVLLATFFIVCLLGIAVYARIQLVPVVRKSTSRVQVINLDTERYHDKIRSNLRRLKSRNKRRNDDSIVVHVVGGKKPKCKIPAPIIKPKCHKPIKPKCKIPHVTKPKCKKPKCFFPGQNIIVNVPVVKPIMPPPQTIIIQQPAAASASSSSAAAATGGGHQSVNVNLDLKMPQVGGICGRARCCPKPIPVPVPPPPPPPPKPEPSPIVPPPKPEPSYPKPPPIPHESPKPPKPEPSYPKPPPVPHESPKPPKPEPSYPKPPPKPEISIPKPPPIPEISFPKPQKDCDPGYVISQFPIFKQCNVKWGSTKLGTGSSTICKAGCLISAIASGLNGLGKSKMDVLEFNTWLKSNGGFYKGNLYVWGSIEKKFGMKYMGVTSDIIGVTVRNLCEGKMVILKLVKPPGKKTEHFVLATGYDPKTKTFNVVDSAFDRTTYTVSEISISYSYSWKK